MFASGVEDEPLGAGTGLTQPAAKARQGEVFGVGEEER